MENCVEENSNIILRPKSRRVSKDELGAKVTKRRHFVSIEKIDSDENQKLVSGKAGYFTVGVVVDRIGVLTSKGGKTFSILKLSDLVKYNMKRVKEFYARQFPNDQEGLKQALKSYNSDGYKTISVMAFNESTLPAKNIKSGTVIAVMNPRMMPPSNQQSAAASGEK